MAKKKRKKILVVGGALSGPIAAVKAREQDWECEITIIERNKFISYPLESFAYILKNNLEIEKATQNYSPDYFKETYNIDTLLETRVTGVNARQKFIEIVSAGTSSKLHYDKLILATGAGSIVPAVLAGIDATNLSQFRTMQDLTAISARLSSKPSSHFCIIGAGYLGLELADALVARGAQVTMIEKRERIFQSKSPLVSFILNRAVSGLVNLKTGSMVQNIHHSNNEVKAIELSTGEVIEADFFVLTAGVRPRSELAVKAGLKLSKDHAIQVDNHCRSSNKNIYVCGVSTAVKTVNSNKAQFLPQAVVADRTSRVAGQNATGKGVALKPFSATYVSSIAGYFFGFCGDFSAEKSRKVVTISAGSIEAGNNKTVMSLGFHRKSGKVLSFEIVSQDNKSSLVNLMSLALSRGIHIRALAVLDAAFLPADGAFRDELITLADIALQNFTGRISGLSLEQTKALKNKRILCLDENLPDQNILTIEKIAPEAIRTLNPKNKDESFVFISKSGKRAVLACQRMRSIGYKAHYIEGGAEYFN